MKILFKSEEEKNHFIETLSPFFCPGDLMVDCEARVDKRGCLHTERCDDCWDGNLDWEMADRLENPNVQFVSSHVMDTYTQSKKLEEVSGHSIDELIAMFEKRGYAMNWTGDSYDGMSYGDFMDRIMKVRNDAVAEILDHIDKKFKGIETEKYTVTIDDTDLTETLKRLHMQGTVVDINLGKMMQKCYTDGTEYIK